jgi:hypothetical protein
MAAVFDITIANLSTEKKLERVLLKAATLLPGDAGEQLKAMVSPTSLAIMAGTLVVWAGAHFFGVGEIADLVLLLVGYVALGGVAVEAARHIAKFIQGTMKARSDADIDTAAQHLARAITLVGIQTVLILLFRKKPADTFKNSWGRPMPKYSAAFKSPLPSNPGLFYKPKLRFTNTKFAGEGGTNPVGDIRIGRTGTGPQAIDAIREAIFHEKVHQFLAPKLQIFREIRIYAAQSGYRRSYILRYLEEAMAETIALLRSRGLSRGTLLQGLRFPIGPRYNISWALIGTEAKGILLGPVTVEGMVYNVFYDLDDEPGRNAD